MTASASARPRSLLATKLFWILLNRAFAWSLIVAMPVQWLLGMSFNTGMLVDLGILLAHAVLSFALFGKPETKARAANLSMYLFGLRLAAMSARNEFLLTGYRVAAGTVAVGLLASPLPLVWLPLLYSLLRLPVSVCQHIARAAGYALRRWGMRGETEGVATMIVVAYVAVSIINAAR